MSSLDVAVSRLQDVLNERILLPMDGDDHAQAIPIFNSFSNQHSLTLAWLYQWITDHFSEASSLDILSVGVGDGAFDLQLATKLMNHKSSLAYVGIEPHADSANVFQHRLSSISGVKADAMAAEWPTCASNLPGTQFDIIIFIHSLYYVPNIEEALKEALHVLKPHGQVIVCIDPSTGLNKLCTTLTSAQSGRSSSLMWAEEVKSALPHVECNIIHESIVEGEMDLSLYRDKTSKEGKAMLDFISFTSIPDDLHEHVLNVLNALMDTRQKGKSSDKLVVDHPMHVWVLEQRRPSSEH